MKTRDDELLKVHGPEKCHICGTPKASKGSSYCSYPHGMLPKEQISDGMWTWELPND